MHKKMHTNVLRFHNTWEEHEAINLRIRVDFKLETLKFANEYFENTKYKIPKPCLMNTSPNTQKLELYLSSHYHWNNGKVFIVTNDVNNLDPIEG